MADLVEGGKCRVCRLLRQCDGFNSKLSVRLKFHFKTGANSVVESIRQLEKAERGLLGDLLPVGEESVKYGNTLAPENLPTP